jgi:hypothetical protein
MVIKHFKILARQRMYLNGRTPDDFKPFEDKRNFSWESIEELADIYNYQRMKRQKLLAQVSSSEYKHLYAGLVSPLWQIFVFWRVIKTFIVQFLVLLVQKIV